jgi:CBS domain-containing protein
MARVAEVMTRGVRSMRPDESIMKAAQAMEELNVGAIPVCEGETLVGMVTDRDIVLRGVAQGCPADSTRLADVMTTDTHCCYEDQMLDDVLREMSAAQIRRMPVVDRDKHLIGIVSLGDAAMEAGARHVGKTLQDISTPSEPDRSGQSQASGAAGGGSAAGDPRGSR